MAAAAHCPVYRPTLEEFSNFTAFLEKIEPEFREVGLCKVIPPPEWRPKLLYDKSTAATIGSLPFPTFPRVRAIKQAMSGKNGAFELAITDRCKPFTAEEFRALAAAHQIDWTGLSHEEVERLFWKSMNALADAPLYGADIPGSLFADAAGGWNLNNLQNFLVDLVGPDMPGVTQAMLYFGTWRSMFAFHKEDMDLYSVNYLHFGAPKAWYGVPPSAAPRLQHLAESLFPEQRKRCSEFTRHKTSVIAPSKLAACAIPFVKALQQPGEFMLTYPKSFHQGFNLGFNCAEAVNFATEHWIEIGRSARLCKCRPDYVYINVDELLRKLQRRTGKTYGVTLPPPSDDSDSSGEKVSRPPVADRSALRIGASVVVEWDGDWYKAKIIDTDAKNVKIRYKGGSAGEDEWIFWQSRRLSLPLPDDDPSDTERKHRNKRPAKRRRSKQPSDEGGMEGKPVLECAPAPQALTGPAKVIVQWDDGHKYVASVKKREGDKLFVHYQGWPRAWDEWIASDSPDVFPWSDDVDVKALNPYTTSRWKRRFLPTAPESAAPVVLPEHKNEEVSACVEGTVQAGDVPEPPVKREELDV